MRAPCSAAAASTGTDGWHTAMTWVLGPIKRMKSMSVVDEVVEVEAAQASGISRASPQSVM